jgi:hypothetical protein
MATQPDGAAEWGFSLLLVSIWGFNVPRILFGDLMLQPFE